MLSPLLHFVLLGGLLAPPVHYRIEVKFRQTADLTILGGSVQENAGTVIGFVTLTERDTLGTHTAEFKFDSVQVVGDSLSPDLQADPSAAKGVTYRATIVNGRPVGGFKSMQVQSHANLFSSYLDAMFPGFKANAKVSDKWTDTLSVKDSIPYRKEITTISSWQVASLADGAQALEGLVTGTSKSVQSSPNGDLTTNSVSTSTRRFTGMPGGAAREGSLSSKQDVTAAFEGSEPFPVKSQQTITITRLP